MIDINTDTVRRLVLLAREIHTQDAVVIPEDDANPSGDWGMQILAAHQDDLSAQEFRSIVSDLEPDQRRQLVALAWVGRGDFGAEEWDDAVVQTEDRESEETAAYLLSHPMLADELQGGLAALGFED